MRLLPIVASLSIAMIAMPMVSERVLSQNATSSTTLRVTILANLGFCSIPSFAGGTYTSSSKIPTGVQNIGILSVCTNLDKFTIRVKSTNGGLLKSTQSSYTLLYKINATSAGVVGGGTGYDLGSVKGGNVSIAETPFQPLNETIIFSVTNDSVKNKCDNNVNGGTNRCDLGIQWQIPAATPVPLGVYTDTLTYTLSEN